MSANALDRAARAVLDDYLIPGADAQLISLGNRGGFSGARLWRVELSSGPFCLRAWPPQGISPERLAWIHRLMGLARTAGLRFVPAVLSTPCGATFVENSERLWDLTRWMPGRADFHQQPTPDRLEAACIALAQLHGAWASMATRKERCPAIHRRLEAVRDWDALLHSGWQPDFSSTLHDDLRPLAEKAWSLLRTWAGWVPCTLAGWENRLFPLQPCLCDIWHDHVLFEGPTVAGIIDYGGLKVDHVAVDLARLLGSMVGEEVQLRAAGLRAYMKLRPLSWEEETLVGLLDETGTVIGLMNWLRWLYRDGKSFENPHAVGQRLAELVDRIERWVGKGLARTL